MMNPTQDVLEQRMNQLEGGVGALATSSGMAAITTSILNVAGAGDEVVAATNLYGGTYNLFATTLPKYGIEVIFVDSTDPEAFRRAITAKTKAVYAEIIGNPSLNVLDIEHVASVAHDSGIPLMVDSTFAPYICRPIEWGADIVIHSATKWIGGHGNSIGGIIIDGGQFDWNREKFPGFTEPDESYHGIRYAMDIGEAAFITKARVQLLRDIGVCISPFNAFLLLQGLETLHLRMREHNKNAQKIARLLNAHPGVSWVSHPSLKSHPSHELAKKYFDEGFFGSIVNFGIKGGKEAGSQLIDNIHLWSHVANVGDAKSLIIHPATTTHQQLSEEALETAGVKAELVRLSVGIESFKDISHALEQALEKATGIKNEEKSK